MAKKKKGLSLDFPDLQQLYSVDVVSLASAECDLKWATKMCESEDMYDLKLCSYHIQQCAEKALVHYAGVVENNALRTHDIKHILNSIDSTDTLSKDILGDVKSLANTLYEWEANSRYNEKFLITQRFCKFAIEVVSDLLEEIKEAVRVTYEESLSEEEDKPLEQDVVTAKDESEIAETVDSALFGLDCLSPLSILEPTK